MATIVTISTDISLCVNTGLVAYAFWISSDGGRLRKSGLLRGRTKNTTLAEARGIANAVHAFVQTKQRVDVLVINTDSKNVVDIAHGYGRSEEVEEVLGVIRRYLEGVARCVTFKHVKGHKNKNTDKRTYVNVWCDKEARRTLRNKLK